MLGFMMPNPSIHEERSKLFQTKPCVPTNQSQLVLTLPALDYSPEKMW
jgi:hypothetical protein